jgi:gliding motility-associated-like protein
LPERKKRAGRCTEADVHCRRFSPNNDGINDELEIRNTEQFPGCEVTIYNRWGEVVFYSKGYSKPWNGTYRNQKVQPEITSIASKPINP